MPDASRRHRGSMMGNPWRDLAVELDKLLACYRVGKRPSGRLLDKIGRLREACQQWDATNILDAGSNTDCRYEFL
jgi:hypothetical protein